MVKRDKILDVPSDKHSELRVILKGVMEVKQADGLLLSGGISSSALAFFSPELPSYTVSLEGTMNSDLKYARLVQKHLNLNLTPIVVNVPDALECLRELIKIQKSYDEVLLNTLALYAAAKGVVKAAGKTSQKLISGEGADVLFRGYQYFYHFSNTQLGAEIDNLNEEELSFAKIGRAIGVNPIYPYLDRRLKAFAKKLRVEDNVTERLVPGDVWDTSADNLLRKSKPPYYLGKLILRESMTGLLPEGVLYRAKTAVQLGSGFAQLRLNLRDMITADEIQKFNREGFHFRDKEHATMYKIYREELGVPKMPRSNSEEECASCHGAVSNGTVHCNTCGADPSNVPLDILRSPN